VRLSTGIRRISAIPCCNSCEYQQVWSVSHAVLKLARVSTGGKYKLCRVVYKRRNYQSVSGVCLCSHFWNSYFSVRLNSWPPSLLHTHIPHASMFRTLHFPHAVYVCVPAHTYDKHSVRPRTKGPGSSVGIATRHVLDSPGIESWWGRDFPYSSTPALGSTQPPIQCVPGIPRG
jgi:hypothetical protein